MAVSATIPSSPRTQRAIGWINQIKSGKIAAHTNKNHPAFNEDIGYNDSGLINLNDFIQRATHSDNQYSNVIPVNLLTYVLPNNYQSFAKLNPFDRNSEFGKSFFNAYKTMIDGVKNDREIGRLIQNKTWSAQDRELWEKKLSHHRIAAFENEPLFKYRYKNAGTSDINTVDENAQFACHEQAIVGGVLMQIIENQLLGDTAEDVCKHKSPTTYYKVGVDWINKNNQTGGLHAIVMGKKTGNINSNGKDYIQNPDDMIDFLNGALVEVSEYKALITNSNHFLPAPLNDRFATPIINNTKEKIIDTKAQKIWNDYTSGADKLRAEFKAVKNEITLTREQKIKGIIADYSESVGWDLIEDEYISNYELNRLIEDLGDSLLTTDVRVVNKPGTDNDRLIINGTEHKVKLDNNVKSQTLNVF